MRETVERVRKAVIEQVLNGPARSSPQARQAAFDNSGVDARAVALLDKVARHAWKVTDEDVAAAQRAGLSDDEIFELTIAAALGQASRQLASARAALAVAVARRGEGR